MDFIIPKLLIPELPSDLISVIALLSNIISQEKNSIGSFGSDLGKWTQANGEKALPQTLLTDFCSPAYVNMVQTSGAGPNLQLQHNLPIVLTLQPPNPCPYHCTTPLFP